MSKIRIIFIAAISVLLIIGAIYASDVGKEEVIIKVHGEKIANSSEIYLISQLYDTNGNIIDDNYDKLDIELWDANGCTGEIYENEHLINGQSVIRCFDGEYNVNVKFYGGLFYKASSYSGKLVKSNMITNLTDNNITNNYEYITDYGEATS